MGTDPRTTLTSRIIAGTGLLSLVTLVIGAMTSYQSRAFEWTTFHVSSLQDDYTNPDGYLIPLLGTLVSQLILMWVSVRLGKGLARSPRWMVFGAVASLEVALILLSVNAVHELVNMANWHLHAVLAHLAFGLLILGHLGLLQAAISTGVKGQRLVLDRRLVLFAFTVVVALFLVPKFTGIDVTLAVFGFPVDVILGACEVIYLTIFYVSLWRIARSLEPTHR